MFLRSAFGFLSTSGLVLLACSSDGNSDPELEPPPDEPKAGSFELRVLQTKVPVLQGASAEVTVEIVRKNGFDDPIEISAGALPNGATMESATVDADVDAVTLRIDAAEDAPHSLPTAVELRGRADELEQKASLTVTVCGHPGAVDESFQQGRAIVPVGAGDDYANAMALAADGKILVAGRSAENSGDFALVRLTRDGDLDASFGDGGKVTTALGSGSDVAYAVAVQEDGKIVVAGSSTRDGTGVDFALVRYLPDGRLDEDFGSGGKVFTSLSDDSDIAYALLIQADGKIVVAGESNQGASNTGLDFALVRYHADGSLDESFGDGGRVLTPMSSGNGRDVVYALASHEIGGEERIVAVGGEGDFAIARYTEDGELDETFGQDGKVTHVWGSVIGAARAVQVLPDGKILVAGHETHDFALLRFTRNGALDTTFGGGTPVITPISEDNWDEAQALAVEADGKILLGGWVYEGSSSSGNFALVRYTEDGELDASFGDGGIVVTEVASKAKNDVANAMLLQTDDRVPTVRVLLAGSANGSNHDFAVARYWR